MTRQEHRQVREQLVDWAESSRPLPSPELARFLGPLRPVPVAAGGRSWRAAVRTGLGLKVMGLVAALAVTGAAAVGVAQVALHEPEPSAPVIVPVEPPSGSSSRSTDPSGRAAGTAGTEESPTPSTTPSPSATSGRHSVTAPTPQKHESHAPKPSPREHTSAPSPEPSDPSDEPSDPSGDSRSPEPTHPVESVTPTSDDASSGSTSG
jgi:hypothetical protein